MPSPRSLTRPSLLLHQRGCTCSCLLFAAMLATTSGGAQAHGGPSSDLSAASAVPVAISIAAPSMVLMAGAQLVVLSVQATARGSVWVLERVSDGVRFSVEVVGQSLVAVGTGVTVLVMGTGWLLSTAAEGGSQALCFVPNEVGRALLHNEQVTR
ncbi:MAG: hypothetical protein IPJ08_23620 [Burkholderiales bacterium]|nr:hypothetical protein [Burkholderiales bacterium]